MADYRASIAKYCPFVGAPTRLQVSHTQRGPKKPIKITITKTAADLCAMFVSAALMSIGLWSYQKLAGPFISQAPVDECLQQISRILCPAPEGGAVFAAKNRYANSSTDAYFSRSSLKSSRFALSPADGNRVAVAL